MPRLGNRPFLARRLATLFLFVLPASIGWGQEIPTGPTSAFPLSGEFLQDLTQNGQDLIQQIPITSAMVLRAVIGFVLLLVLAYLSDHPRVRQLERRLNIAHLTTTGLPFVVLGYIASRPFTGILPPDLIGEIGPLLPLGLGWIGFVIGSRFTGTALDRFAPGVAAGLFTTTGVPLVVIFLVSTLLLRSFDSLLILTQGKEALRDGIILAAAGAMTARSSPHFFRSILGGEASPRLARITEVSQLGGVAAMMFISTYFRPPNGAVEWQLPGTAWLFIVFGLGFVMGLVITGILTKLSRGPQFTAALLGSVAFTAGMASYLRVSPIAVCCIAGAMLMNLGGEWRNQAREVLERMERPVYFIFLFIAGALWHPDQVQGWILMLIFITARLLSKSAAVVLLRYIWLPDITFTEGWTLAAAPMGALSIAMIVSARDLYTGAAVGWMVTAIIGGSIVMEFAIQLAVRRSARARAGFARPAASVQTGA